MKLAIVFALVAACGGAAGPADSSHQTAGDERLIIGSVELRGVSSRHRAAVSAVAAAHFVTGVELTRERSALAYQAILEHYYERGHINVVLVVLKWAPAVVLRIDEGPVFAIASLDVKDVSDADRARYVALSTNRPGEPFARSKLVAWMQAVADATPGRSIVVVPENSVDLVAHTIALTLVLKNP